MSVFCVKNCKNSILFIISMLQAFVTSFTRFFRLGFTSFTTFFRCKFTSFTDVFCLAECHCVLDCRREQILHIAEW